MKLWRTIKNETSGQSVIETALFLMMMLLFVAFTLNVNYYVGFVQTIHSASQSSADFSAQGSVTGSSTAPSASAVAQAARNETANTVRNTNEAAPTVNVCSQAIGTSSGATECSAGGTAAFVDPESGSSTSTGRFYGNAVTVTQTFTPFISGTFMGHQLMPFSAPSSFSHTVYMRALN